MDDHPPGAETFRFMLIEVTTLPPLDRFDRNVIRGGFVVPTEIAGPLMDAVKAGRMIESSHVFVFNKGGFAAFPDGWDDFCHSVKCRLEPFGVEVGFSIEGPVVKVGAGLMYNGRNFRASREVKVSNLQYPVWPGTVCARDLMTTLMKAVGYAAEPEVPPRPSNAKGGDLLVTFVPTPMAENPFRAAFEQYVDMTGLSPIVAVTKHLQMADEIDKASFQAFKNGIGGEDDADEPITVENR